MGVGREMSLFSSPSAASKMIRARWAKPCAVFRRDAKPPSSRGSLSLNLMAICRQARPGH
jgi:hypothetical protein